MTPRVVDWGLAAVVWALFATGIFALYTGNGEQAWVFGAHAGLGFALAALLVWKVRRVWSRISFPWDSYTGVGVCALGFVVVVLGSGWLWSAGVNFGFAGYNLLAWHIILATTVVALVWGHALLRRKPLRRRDLVGGGSRSRRQFLLVGGVAAGAVGLWALQRPFYGLLGFRGADRRFTGSFDSGGYVRPTSWVADDPRVIDDPSYRLRVDGLVASPVSLAAADLAAGDSVTAILDCTSGWYAENEWQGIRLSRLFERAGGVLDDATHIRVVSHTGYRWAFPLREADRLLLATHLAGEPLPHGNGAPARLVAPGRRGWHWVKWVVRIELIDHADRAAPASTVWSSTTPEGRGEA